jgi:hypothetical protein
MWGSQQSRPIGCLRDDSQARCRHHDQLILGRIKLISNSKEETVNRRITHSFSDFGNSPPPDTPLHQPQGCDPDRPVPADTDPTSTDFGIMGCGGKCSQPISAKNGGREQGAALQISDVTGGRLWRSLVIHVMPPSFESERSKADETGILRGSRNMNSWIYDNLVLDSARLCGKSGSDVR